MLPDRPDKSKKTALKYSEPRSTPDPFPGTPKIKISPLISRHALQLQEIHSDTRILGHRFDSDHSHGVRRHSLEAQSGRELLVLRLRIHQTRYPIPRPSRSYSRPTAGTPSEDDIPSRRTHFCCGTATGDDGASTQLYAAPELHLDSTAPAGDPN
ncbi:hypothetical protein DFP72DRAFT_1080005 [Ephemerocybe angulata]|uniref:Uncharacterized protein n=1 Tax=Ephemerocybe angulata TaxID=980116 RepID=A0A8H6HC83_9AGAR|nr:hypothetical protein DFP72DRAFT_1080005 [Tulosesus angulatus]